MNPIEIISLPEIIKEVFDSIFVSYGDKCFSHPKHYTENPILNALFNNLPIEKDTKDRTADDVFYEYLLYIKDQTNKKYLTFAIRFILLFRECFNSYKKKETDLAEENARENKPNPETPIQTQPDTEEPKTVPENRLQEISKKEFSKNEEFSATNSGETLPDLCNEFYTEFMEGNNFFGFDEDEKNEIIEIIQHFCIWLFKNEYTKSKLSLAQ